MMADQFHVKSEYRLSQLGAKRSLPFIALSPVHQFHQGISWFLSKRSFLLTCLNLSHLRTANYTTQNIHGIPHSMSQFDSFVPESDPKKLWDDIIKFLTPLLQSPTPHYLYSKVNSPLLA
eukprot:TRINITY_DN5893_c0_g1_i1.p1 TRINITY_DN5893_c0_g1~~TRINITY_DN5893_c0_g1_i1.p1  ORF type:complete len:120 (+),score=6.21 TRINITY_DN5893_c0_g1_i1:152-511(+)